MNRVPRIRPAEERLIGFASAYLVEAFPNPDRFGCPPEAALRHLAETPTSADLSITQHLGSCSPCFQQYQDLLAAMRTQKVTQSLRASLLRPILAVSVTALAVALMVIAIAQLHSHPENALSSPSLGRPDAVRKAPIYAPFVLDMTHAGRSRGVDDEVRRPSLEMPRRPLHIIAYLPLGSDDGEYTVTATRENQSVWSATGIASVRNQRMTLEFEENLNSYPKGRYTLLLLSREGLTLTQEIVVYDALQRR